jgi:redox-sensitive bicupin YhaK (pirin superfamily)
MEHDVVMIAATTPLGFPWRTRDPFLFCVHHLDAYPAGNEALGPAASLEGRDLGQDFASVDGWNMYHGDVVPGFPAHPHRGFETVTVVTQGIIDHSDSLGAAGRYGAGDTQWMTAGRGVQHAEMFPLLDPGKPNPLELFQIWLNLPRAGKMAAPYFAMLWREQIPRLVDGGAEITVVAGALGDARPPAPPPDSWASRPEAGVAIWHLRLAAGARFTLPAAPAGVDRTLYFYRGTTLRAPEAKVGHALALLPEREVALENGDAPAELLFLAGRPIGEPVAASGPFVMNSPAEVQQAYLDYRRTRFGGWPWPSDAPVRPREEGRFARHTDGRIERPGG